jgi:hypothetical protein
MINQSFSEVLHFPLQLSLSVDLKHEWAQSDSLESFTADEAIQSAMVIRICFFQGRWYELFLMILVGLHG